jgi:hypothetical protein
MYPLDYLVHPHISSAPPKNLGDAPNNLGGALEI